MRRLWVIVVLFAACRAERGATTTIAPAEPRPAPTATARLDDRPMITTSGSPVPAGALAPGTQVVTVNRGGIAMRSLVPRGHTVFHITNETALQHDLVLRTASATAASAAVPPRGRTVLQAPITERVYTLACVTAGHGETAEFATYAAGTPLNVPPAAPPRP